MTELCKCGEPADGLGPNTCQMCWEQHCADTYWDQHNAMVQADIALFEVHARERGLNLSRVPSCNDYFDDSTQEACIAWLAAKEQAAQQKEGYVLVPVDQAKDTQRIDWLADKNQNIGNVMLPTVCVEQNLHSLRGAIDMAMIVAAQEAE